MTVTKDDLKLSLRIDISDDDVLIDRYIQAATFYIKNAVGGDDEFWKQDDVAPLFDLAVSSLAGAYYEYRVALQDVVAYPIDLTLNAIIGQLRGKLATYENEVAGNG